MASGWYDRALADILTGVLVSGASLKAMLVGSGYTFDPTHQYVADVVAHEIAATNYVGGFGGAGRHLLPNVLIVEDGPSFRRVLSSDNPAPWLVIGGAVNATVRFILLVEEVSSDADSPVRVCLQLPTPYLTKGVTFTINLVNPIGYVQRGA